MSSSTDSSITVLINGEPCVIPSRRSVSALLEYLELPSDRIAVELNKSIIRKRDWPEALVVDQAQIEIVEFVGGG